MKARAKRRKEVKVPGVNIAYWNMRSLLPEEKQESVRQLIQKQKLEILCLAETWFRADARSHGFDCEGYKVRFTVGDIACYLGYGWKFEPNCPL